MQGSSVKQVFISHATQDAGFAHRLADDLKRLGLRVWIAPDSIRPGEGWVKAIERGMGESSHVVIALTPAALESKWVEKETEVAIAQERNGRIEVIPLSVEACQVPLLLSSYQMVFFRQDYEAGLSRLARVLGLSAPSAEPGPPQPVAEPRAARPAGLDRQPFEPELIRIPAGEFLMGSDPRKDKDASDEEQPQHSLSLPDYYIAKTPLTNAQYGAFLKATDQRIPTHWEGGKPPAGKEDHPVVNVSWHDAVAYCRWLTKVTGRAFRLPSEAEWEKAARGTDGRIWPWGDDSPDETRCNFDHNVEDTTPVGQYSPGGDSPYACVDMAGNVWEWTLSQWGKGWAKPDFKYPYDLQDGRENLEAGDDIARMCRGGAFCHDGKGVRCAVKSGYGQNYWNDLIGFRVCVAAGQE